SCPVGPWIETDLDPADLQISSSVDGEIAQQGTTADMLRPVADLIAEISAVATLLPGDLVLTGTPAGVRTVPAGAAVDITVEGIGTLSNPITRRRPARRRPSPPHLLRSSSRDHRPRTPRRPDRRGPGPLLPQPHRHAARRHGAHRPVQLGPRPPSRRQADLPHRGHRRRP